MKNTIKLVVLFLTLTFSNNISAQKKWVVEYNKLADTFLYYEVLTAKGKESEKPLSKAPAVYNGDVVKFRCINLNEYVFSVKMKDTNGELIKEQSSSGMAGTFVSLFNPLGFAGNFGRTVQLMENIPTLQGMTLNTRGSSAAIQLQQDIVDAKEELSELIEFASIAESPTGILYAEDLTIDEIRDKFNTACSKVDISLFNQRKTEFKLHLIELKKQNQSIEKVETDLTHAIAEISSTYEEFANAYEGKNSPIDFERIKKDLEKRKFSVEKTIVVSNSNLGTDNNGTSTNIYWNLEFSADRRPKASTEDESAFLKAHGSDAFFTSATENTLRSNVIATLPVRGTIMPKLSTGLMMSWPLGGYDSYTFTMIPGDFGLGDSLTISASKNKSSQLLVGTMVNFAVTTNRNISPSFGFGASYSLTKGNESALGLLLGGNLSLKSFPFLSLSYGVNFRQTKVLKPQYNVDVPILESEIDNSTGEYNLFDYVFKPGFFIGLSMQL